MFISLTNGFGLLNSTYLELLNSSSNFYPPPELIKQISLAIIKNKFHIVARKNYPTGFT
jgi:hypothetical protein